MIYYYESRGGVYLIGCNDCEWAYYHRQLLQNGCKHSVVGLQDSYNIALIYTCPMVILQKYVTLFQQ